MVDTDTALLKFGRKREELETTLEQLDIPKHTKSHIINTALEMSEQKWNYKFCRLMDELINIKNNL